MLNGFGNWFRARMSVAGRNTIRRGKNSCEMGNRRKQEDVWRSEGYMFGEMGRKDFLEKFELRGKFRSGGF